jgi:chromodomain-helicase-DNA-binding protein 7
MVPRAATEAAEGDEEGEEDDIETYYLVKWRGLGYEGCTWEYARIAGADAIAAYEERQRVLANRAASDAEPPTPEVDVPMSFKGGRTLRDYQRAGVQWMRWNYVRGRSVILGDEMGLGKTAQSATLLHCLHTFHKAKGPYLIVVPLSTVPHWQREVRDGTSLHAVLFH